MNLRADHRPALHCATGPFFDALAYHLNRQNEKRESDQNEKQRRHHFVGERKPHDKTDRDENLERRHRDFGKYGRKDRLDLLRIVGDARHQLPDVHAPIKLKILFLNMLQKILT